MNYNELEVWQRAIDLSVDVYRATEGFPSEERFGLRIQMRRAAVSIPSNIAEGDGRRSRRDHRRFVLQARGSLYELETQLVICEKLGYLEELSGTALRNQARRVGQLINGFLRHLSRTTDNGSQTTRSQ
jgi:four helix bundle protein